MVSLNLVFDNVANSANDYSANSKLYVLSNLFNEVIIEVDSFRFMCLFFIIIKFYNSFNGSETI